MSSGLVLYVGNKNLSSWSLRPYLALAQAGASFDEVVIPLDRPDTREKLLAMSPSGRVPVLRDGALLVWDSLAICEHVAERFPEAHLWPEDRVARAAARSVSAEMHAGFSDLRREMPMNIAARTPRPATPAVARDIERVLSIWTEHRARYAERGPFLFGPFTIADAMYAPVVTRFVTYAVPVPAEAQSYMDTVLALPAMRRWTADALEELRAP
ncbi:MAG: glutathione S-transferase family protein [Polyangiaceae bacterium]